MRLEYDDGELWPLPRDYKQIHRKSMLVGAFSVLENKLNLLCPICGKLVDSKIELSDFRGSGIDKAMKYLNKVVGIEFPTDRGIWQTLKKVQKVRNSIVHNNGEIKFSKLENELKGYIEKCDLIKLDGAVNAIIFERGYIEHCLNLFKKFFQKLCEKVVEFEVRK